MKKFGKYICAISSFLFAFFFVFNPIKVEAKGKTNNGMYNLYKDDRELTKCIPDDQFNGDLTANFWTKVCGDYIIEEPEGPKYNYESYPHKANVNFKFPYSYSLSFIKSAGIQSNVSGRYFVIKNGIDVEYFDLDPQDGRQNDRFIAYKYNFVSNQFDSVYDSGSPNKSGTFKITEKGIYKLQTSLSLGAVETNVYVAYETDFVDSKIESIDYDYLNRNLIYTVDIMTPEDLNNLSKFDVRVNDITLNVLDSKVTIINNNDIQYRISITLDIPDNFFSFENKDADLKINDQLFSTKISLDAQAPMIDTNIKYFPKNLYIDELSIPYDEYELNLGYESQAVVKVSDSSLFSFNLNNTACVYNESLDAYVCDIDVYQNSSLEYKAVDDYGNETTFVQNGVIFTEMDYTKEEISSNIKFNSSGVEFVNVSNFPRIETMCMFYNGLKGNYVCSKTDGTSLNLNTNKYYQGNVTILVADDTKNVISIDYENILLNNGYNKEDFIKSDIVGDLTHQENISEYVNQLLALACGEDSECLKNAVIYAKYNDNMIEIAKGDNTDNLLLPTYVDILNKGFRSGTKCAKQACDETVEVVVKYNVEGVDQSLSAYYKYVDKLPNIITNIIIKDVIEYHFTSFDPTLQSVKNELFGYSVPVYLMDSEGVQHIGNVNSRFIQYKSKDGLVVKDIDNKPYDYLAEAKEFGIYTLECYVTITDEGKDPITGKSFFIPVILSDLVDPVVSLIGSQEMKVKQNDVFKDPGVSFEDDSDCTTVTKYFFDGEEVEGVDTKIAGKYLIEYTVTDADGNSTVITRDVIIESVNTMDTTSIIIIVVVVLAFIIFITIGILYQVKKRKEEDK